MVVVMMVVAAGDFARVDMMGGFKSIGLFCVESLSQCHLGFELSSFAVIVGVVGVVAVVVVLE